MRRSGSTASLFITMVVFVLAMASAQTASAACRLALMGQGFIQDYLDPYADLVLDLPASGYTPPLPGFSGPAITLAAFNNNVVPPGVVDPSIGPCLFLFMDTLGVLKNLVVTVQPAIGAFPVIGPIGSPFVLGNPRGFPFLAEGAVPPAYPSGVSWILKIEPREPVNDTCAVRIGRLHLFMNTQTPNVADWAAWIIETRQAFVVQPPPPWWPSSCMPGAVLREMEQASWGNQVACVGRGCTTFNFGRRN